jgi:hypothetical protein
VSDESPEQYSLVLVSIGKDGSAHQAAWDTGKEYLEQLRRLMTRFFGPAEEAITTPEGMDEIGACAEKAFIFLGDGTDGS